MITLEQVRSRFDENNLEYRVEDLAHGYSILVSQYGGRIFGPFKDGKDSCCWINPLFADREKFRRFVSEKNWNIGGDRIWLEPELQYNVPEPADFWGSYTVPEDIDPGHYSLEIDEDKKVRLFQEMDLTVYSKPSGRKNLKIERSIYRAVNPFPDLDMEFCGYHHEIALEESARDGVISGAWNLLQVKPEGVLYIPTVGEAGYVDYYDPIPDEYQRVGNECIKVKIDGRCQYKVGYSSLDTIGRSGYFSRFKETSYLLIRLYGNRGGGNYPLEELDANLNSGISLRVYNDNGKMGDFAEHECSCLPLGGNPYRRKNRETVTNLFFFGDEEVLRVVAKAYLNVDLGV